MGIRSESGLGLRKVAIVTPAGKVVPVEEQEPDLCVCGPKTRGEYGCECNAPKDDAPKHEKPVVYIAGPMTGLPEYNYPAFFSAQERWEKAGWKVLNPAVLPPATQRQRETMSADQIRAMFMRQDIEWLMAAEAIALLSGWEGSVGAKTELAVAKVLGHKVYDAETMLPVNAPALSL